MGRHTAQIRHNLVAGGEGAGVGVAFGAVVADSGLHAARIRHNYRDVVAR
jgi:hypothetical protein